MPESEAGVEQPEPRQPVRRNKRPLRRNRSLPLTDAEYQLIDEAARLCGKTTRAFIREAALGVPIKVQPFLADAELIRELGSSALALARLAATARASGALPAADELDTARVAVLALIRQIERAHAAAAPR
jgi:uncharacterized protein (DUF1778 family)